MRSALDVLLDAVLAMHLGVQRFGTLLAADALAILARHHVVMAARLRAQLDLAVATGDARTLIQIATATADLGASIESAFQAVTDHAIPQLGRLATVEANAQATILGSFRAPGVDKPRPLLPQPYELVAVPSAAPLDPDRGLTFAQEISAAAARQLRDVTGEVQRLWTAGEPPAAIIRRLVGTQAAGYSDGALAVGRANAKTLAHTAVAATSNKAKEDFLKANPDLADRIIITAVMDPVTTFYCRKMNGTVFSVGVGPRPPFHFNCRTTFAPIPRGWAPPELPDYNAWLRRQPASMQDRFLGKRRGRIFRANPNMHQNDFLDVATGKPWSLDRLQEFGLSLAS